MQFWSCAPRFTRTFERVWGSGPDSYSLMLGHCFVSSTRLASDDSGQSAATFRRVIPLDNQPSPENGQWPTFDRRSDWGGDPFVNRDGSNYNGGNIEFGTMFGQTGMSVHYAPGMLEN